MLFNSTISGRIQISTFTPLSVNSAAPDTKGFGSIEPMTTLGILCSSIKLVQGGVFPTWEHGSKVTYRVHFDKLLVFSKALFIAITSACASPAFW